MIYLLKLWIVYNLIHGIDIEATEAQISLYQTENMQSIREKQSRIVEEERRIDMLIKYEREAAAKLAQEIQVIYFFLFFIQLIII